MTGIRLAGLKSTGMTSANAQNRGIGWGGTTAAVRLRTQCIHTLRVCHTLKGVYKCMGMHIFNIQV